MLTIVLLSNGCAASHKVKDPYKYLRASPGQAQQGSSKDVLKKMQRDMRPANEHNSYDDPYIPIRTSEDVHPFLEWDRVWEKNRKAYLGKRYVWVVVKESGWWVEDITPQGATPRTIVPYLAPEQIKK